MSAAVTAPETTPEGDAQWHRLSPRMLLVHPVIELLRALPALLGIFFANSGGGHGLRSTLVLAGLLTALGVSRWFTTRLRITPEQVQLRHGLLRRRTVATRRDRIRTVDVTSHVLHRVLGLARVVVGTGISDRSGKSRIVLDGLTRSAAQALRDDLLHRAPPVAWETAEQASAPVAEGADVELARLDRRWIRYAPFTLSGVLTGLVIYGFVTRVQGESGVNLLRSQPLRAVAGHLDRLSTPALIAAVVLSLVIFIAVTSTAGYVLAFWNFRLRRNAGGTVQVTRGLLTTRSTSIERRRLVGVEISEALVLRAVGGARLLAVATGLRVGRGAERGGEVLLPPAPRAVVDELAGRVLDGSPAATAPLEPHGRPAARRRLVRAIAFGVVLAAAGVGLRALGAPLWLAVTLGLPVVAAVPLARDRYRSLGHAHTDHYLVASLGSIVRRRTVLHESAVIGWNVRASLFQRRAGVVTLTATTAAGRQAVRIVDVAAGAALELAERVAPGSFAAVRLPGEVSDGDHGTAH